MAFSLNETTLLNAVSGGSLTSVLDSVLSPGYSITVASVDPNSMFNFAFAVGSEVFTPTSWIGFERMSEASVSNAPIERGSYTSYNKVRRPGQIRLTFTLEGWTGYSGAIPNLTNFTTLSREKLINLLDQMIASANTYTVETPDTTFSPCDLVHYDYQTREGRGVTLLTVNAYFQEVINTSESATTSNATSSLNSSVSTVTTQSSLTGATLSDVKKAWSSANGTLTNSLATTADYVTTEINNAATTIANSWDKSSTSVASQMKSGVSKLLSSGVL